MNKWNIELEQFRLYVKRCLGGVEIMPSLLHFLYIMSAAEKFNFINKSQ